MSWSLITKDWSYIHWLKNDIDTDEMNRLFYDGSGKGGNAGRQSAELEMKEEMWTCVQGAEVTVPGRTLRQAGRSVPAEQSGWRASRKGQGTASAVEVVYR